MYRCFLEKNEVEIRFNNDSGNNYAYRRQQTGGTDTTVTSNSSIRLEKPNTNEDCFVQFLQNNSRISIQGREPKHQFVVYIFSPILPSF